MNNPSGPGAAAGGGSASSTPATGVAGAAGAAAASAVAHSHSASSGTSPAVMHPGSHPIQPRPLSQQAHAHVAPSGSGYLAGTGYGGPPAPAYPPAGHAGVSHIPPPPPTAALSQIRAAQAQQANAARWVEREMAMAAQQAAISARQQQQQATLIELEQARVRRALAQYAAAGNINPTAAAAAAAAGVGAAGLSTAATAPPGAALGGIDTSNSSALYGRTSAANPVAPSGAKRPGVEGIAAGASSGGGSQPSTPQPKKQKLSAGIGRPGEDTAEDVIVVEESKPATSTAHTTHRVLQTGLAGPFVRGVLGDDERTLATFRSQIGMGPRYFASQILNLAETPFRKDSIVIKMSNIDKLGLRISDGHSLYTKHAVEITSEEMRRKHESLVSGMEERIKQLEDELASTRSKAGPKSTAENAGDRESAPINNGVLETALKKAEEEYKESLAAIQAAHADETRKLKEKHEDTARALRAEIREAKKTHSRTLDSYLQASCEVLKLVRREEKARLI